MPIRIPTSGEYMRVTVPGERQKKFGGVAGSENGERVAQGWSCSELMCEQCASEGRSESSKKSHFGYCTYFLALYDTGVS